MTSRTDSSRRTLLGKIALGICAIPIAGLPLSAALADDLPLLTADDPTAKAYGYVGDASRSSSAKPGSRCANCALYQGGAGSAQGGCPLYPGKQVLAAGVCNAWIKRI
jgi:hypothetical protein